MSALASEPAGDIVAALRRAGVAGVDASDLARSLYASDASLYRVPPRVVATPRTADEVVGALTVCRELAVPVTMRGAGTSIAGNAIGPGVVLDVARHLTRILDVDEEAGTATVEPGVVHASLQRRVRAAGWRFGPDPSTHDRATIGGMVGNNACGTRALGYGRTADNVLGLDVVTGAGERLAVAGGIPGSSPTLEALDTLAAAHLATIRTEHGRFTRQVSGYSMEHLLPEHGRAVERFLVGSEGTLAVTLAATVRLVRDEPERLLLVLSYPSMADAADAVPAVLAYRPVACEGLDARIVDAVRAQRGTAAVPSLPAGEGWLFVEFAGDSAAELTARAQACAATAGALGSRVVGMPGEAAALWRIRADGAGLSSTSPAGLPAHAGWEDAAVPPAQLGGYLRDFDALLTQHGLTGMPYGHLGDGCLHIRVDVPLDRPGGRAAYRGFVEDAAAVAASHGGSFSGEHGDGRARSELLPLMYSPQAIGLFAQVKALFDPTGLLNPGVLVDPAPLDEDLRLVAAGRAPVPVETPLRVGDFGREVHRCNGTGKCHVDHREDGGGMCPSHRATGRDEDSTRGRSRLLQDAVAGHLGDDPWNHPALVESLDTCLACKACASECPTGVDLATSKAIALHERFRGRRRPRANVLLGHLPEIAARLAPLVRPAAAGRLAGRVAGMPRIARLVAAAAGIDPRRGIPVPVSEPFRRWFDGRRSGRGDGPEIVLFTDTFTQWFEPGPGQATVTVLKAAGYRPVVTTRQVCCGLTHVTTGQLDEAAERAEDLVTELLPHVRAGRLVVGVEPSCLATIRDDVPRLVAASREAEAREVAAATRTLAELLGETPQWSPPSLEGVTALAQPHCHHAAVLGWEADAALLAGAGAEVDRVAGCCGMAGSFGVEHHDLSVTIAQDLLGRISAAPDAVVLADGFGCRTQVADLAPLERGRTRHLAELLAERLG